MIGTCLGAGAGNAILVQNHHHRQRSYHTSFPFAPYSRHLLCRLCLHHRMSSAPPTPPTRPASGPPVELNYVDPGSRQSAANSLYGLQVRAFVEAAEVVDADPEVIEDILDGFLLDSPSAGPEDLDASEDGDVDVEAEGAPGPANAARGEEVDNAADVGGAGDAEEEFAAYLQEGKLLPRLGIARVPCAWRARIVPCTAARRLTSGRAGKETPACFRALFRRWNGLQMLTPWLPQRKPHGRRRR